MGPDEAVNSRAVESLPEVAAFFGVSIHTVKEWAHHSENWTGTYYRPSKKRGSIITEVETFFPRGTMEANKDKFPLGTLRSRGALSGEDMADIRLFLGESAPLREMMEAQAEQNRVILERLNNRAAEGA